MSAQDVVSLHDVFDLAMQCEAKGDHDQALSLLRQLHEMAPAEPEFLHSTGTILANMGKLDAAVLPLWEAVQRSSSAINIYDLLIVLLNQKRTEEVDSVCRATKAIVDTDPRLLGLWGYALMSLKRFTDAIPVLKLGLTLDPDLNIPAIRHNLSICLVEAGRSEESVAMFSRLAKPWTNETQAKDIGEHYALHATGYDDNPLHRSFSANLVAHYRDTLARRPFGQVLDLGCGTGLLADQLDHTADELTGIDVSHHMLDRARVGGNYDLLVQDDLVAGMADLSESFDTIFAACVLYHIADLRPAVEQAARLLRPGGIFAFSVDPLTDGQDIGAMGNGEFCHSRDYLRRLCAEFRLVERTIAIGAHRGPPGFWCVFSKPEGAEGYLH